MFVNVGHLDDESSRCASLFFPALPLGEETPGRPSHDWIAGQVGDPTEVATVTCHQDVSLVAPALAPTVNQKKKQLKRERSEG